MTIRPKAAILLGSLVMAVWSVWPEGPTRALGAFDQAAAPRNSQPVEAAIIQRVAKGPVAGDFYVAPDGHPGNAGSAASPWDLATALGGGKAVAPGSLIWVRGGVYGDGKTIFYSRLKGTAVAPIVVKQYPGEHATVNGWVQVGCCDQNLQPDSGGYTWFWGLEFSNSLTDRTGSPTGPPDWGKTAMIDAIDSWSPGTRFVNLIIHDTREGIGWWKEAADGEAYGNLIYYNGFQASDRGHGHGIYVQNKEGTKIIADNIIFDQFGVGIHGYGSAQAWVRNIEIRGNILFNNGTISARGMHDNNMLFGVGTGVDNLVVENNFTYHTPSDDQGYSAVGWQFSPSNMSAKIANNYWIGGDQAVVVSRWSKLAFTNNTMYSNGKFEVSLGLVGDQKTASYIWNNNTYYGSGKFLFNSEMMWDRWKTVTGMDAGSKFTPGRPTGAWIFVRPNRYEKGRANIVVYNWDLKDHVAVDLSSVVSRGSRFEVRDAQNFFGAPVYSATYDGKPVSLPLTGAGVSKPTGNIPTPPKHTTSEFGAFVVLPN